MRAGTETLSNEQLRGVIPGWHERAPCVQIRVLIVEECVGTELAASAARRAGNVQPEKTRRVIRARSCRTRGVVIRPGYLRRGETATGQIWPEDLPERNLGHAGLRWKVEQQVGRREVIHVRRRLYQINRHRQIVQHEDVFA